MLDTIRRALLDEARSSPGLLSDLAGLEEYVAESYDSRSFIELLQNADDAGAKRFAIARVGKVLVVANDGRPFTDDDFQSLCRSAASHKSRGSSIGYRGIGFKSVVTFAREVFLCSGPLQAVFSRDRTKEVVPKAVRVPLVRIPHPFSPADEQALATVIRKAAHNGFSTVFIFEGLSDEALNGECASFDPSTLLFLRSVRSVSISAGTNPTTCSLSETATPDGATVVLKTADSSTSWQLRHRDGITLALAMDEQGIRRLLPSEAVVHAFLPTHEPTGLGIKINGDVSTDPSRTRIVLDERSRAFIGKTADYLVDVLFDTINSAAPDSTAARLIEALRPVSDLRLAYLKRPTFERELALVLAEKATAKFASLRLCPEWITNGREYRRLAVRSNLRTCPAEIECLDGADVLFKALGASEATLDELAPALVDGPASAETAAEIANRVASLYETGQLPLHRFDRNWKLWPAQGTLLTLNDTVASSSPLDSGFLQRVIERSGSLKSVRRLIAALENEATGDRLLGEDQQTLGGKVSAWDKSPVQAQPQTIPSQARFELPSSRWRTSELQALEVLRLQGWQLKDVSKENLGYDLEGRTPIGEEAFVEVKLVRRPRDEFTMTSNEANAAREKGDGYYLAIMCNCDDGFQIALVRNPLNCLQLVRRVRQWELLCEAYPFNPVFVRFT